MWFIRVLRIPNVEKQTNECILEEFNRVLCLKIKMRSQAKFFGNVMRRQELSTTSQTLK